MTRLFLPTLSMNLKVQQLAKEQRQCHKEVSPRERPGAWGSWVRRSRVAGGHTALAPPPGPAAQLQQAYCELNRRVAEHKCERRRTGKAELTLQVGCLPQAWGSGHVFPPKHGPPGGRVGAAIPSLGGRASGCTGGKALL